MTTYSIYCGNHDCPSRTELVDTPAGQQYGRTFDVFEDDIPDGEVWECIDCTAPPVLPVETQELAS